MKQEEANAWWTTLNKQGVVLSPPVLEELYRDGPPPVVSYDVDRLRRVHQRFLADPKKNLGEWLDAVLEKFLQHSKPNWLKGDEARKAYYHDEPGRQRISAHRVLLNARQKDQPRFLVYVDRDRVSRADGTPGRVGVHGGRKAYGQFLALLRGTGVELGILTNGHQFRLVHAGMDTDHWVEWDASAWFEGGEGRDALAGFHALLGEPMLKPDSKSDRHPLLERIKESRERQADLSHVMGVQVRQAVELVLQALDDALDRATEEERKAILEPLESLGMLDQRNLDARYQAAIRIAMRFVVVSYAESRGLLPMGNEHYLDSYSLDGLFRGLQQARVEEGEDVLEGQYGAWHRLLSLSRLIYRGSAHKDLPIHVYGGQLFRPPVEGTDDPVLAALAVYEHDKVQIDDETTRQILQLLKIGQYRTGKRGGYRKGPVDFSDLRTEYIGMMYEGLLDFQLRRTPQDDGIVFLNLGDQPALPLSVLNGMLEKDKPLKQLLEELRKTTPSDDVEEDDDTTEILALLEKGEDVAVEEKDEVPEDAPAGERFDHEVKKWAYAVVSNPKYNLVAKSRLKGKDTPQVRKILRVEAERLIAKKVPPNGTYLVNWSGARKGSGTFYTKPGLAVPTVHRTLRPLAYEVDENGEKTLIPNTPDEILSLKVCDPAMGSGSFLIAAARYLTRALKESFLHHVYRNPAQDGGDGPRASPLGKRAKGLYDEFVLPNLESGDDEAEARLEAHLKRAVVEHCIYGVDINPLAVELAKLSLWVETMDPELPFSFIDHKLKVGNSLVGAWLHEYTHYPLAAWQRQAGDGPKNERTKRIKALWRDRIKPEMLDHLETQRDPQQSRLEFVEEDEDTQSLERLREVLARLHRARTEDSRERIYQEEILGNPDLERLKHAMDRWCAIWYWPVDHDERPVLSPKTFYQNQDDEETRKLIGQLSRRHRFFHWEIEFPEVFMPKDWGFDATLGNPPWDTSKPNSLEFFTRYRPDYRTLGKQEGLKAQKALFEAQPTIQQEWWDYNEAFKATSNYVRNAAQPLEGPLGSGKKVKQEIDKYKRITTASAKKNPSLLTPYRHQGSGDLNLYKLFTERFHSILDQNGRMGILTPSGLYSDYGTKDLRELFFNRNQWEWIYSFENKKAIFDIHRSFKFTVSIIQKAGKTSTIKARFMAHNLDDWAYSGIPEYIEIAGDTIKKLSPNHGRILEVESQRDISILEKVASSCKPLMECNLEYWREFNLATDADKIIHFSRKEREELVEKSNGVWKGKDGDIYCAFYNGAMIHQFDFAYQGYFPTQGWVEIEWLQKILAPKFFMSKRTYEIAKAQGKSPHGPKVVFRKTARDTDRRTMVAAVIPDFPCADTVTSIRTNKEISDVWVLAAFLNSYAFDFYMRYLQNSPSIALFNIEEVPIPSNLTDSNIEKIRNLSRSLNCHPDFFLQNDDSKGGDFVMGNYERAKIREELDDIIATAYGLSDDDMKWILRMDNPDPRSLSKDYRERVDLLRGKAKWAPVSVEGNTELAEVVR